MPIEYRELRTEDDFAQCLDLQRRVFGFSETDLVSPLLFKLIARENPPMGINVGVFDVRNDGQRLMGVMLGFATFLEKSVYTVLLGILPEYQSGIYGYKLLLKFREIGLSKGVRTMYGVFEPLESNLARLYMGGVGFVATQYNIDTSDTPIPSDKFLFKWDFDSAHTEDKLAGGRKNSLDEIMGSTPLATAADMPDAGRVLIEIPVDWLELKQSEPGAARRFRLDSRLILDTYVNQRKYHVTGCYSGKAEGGRKTYYLLEKQSTSAYT